MTGMENRVCARVVVVEPEWRTSSPTSLVEVCSALWAARAPGTETVADGEERT